MLSTVIEPPAVSDLPIKLPAFVSPSKKVTRIRVTRGGAPSFLLLPRGRLPIFPAPLFSSHVAGSPFLSFKVPNLLTVSSRIQITFLNVYSLGTGQAAVVTFTIMLSLSCSLCIDLILLTIETLAGGQEELAFPLSLLKD